MEYFFKIPNGINLIIFIWSMVGLLLFLTDRKLKKDYRFYILLVCLGVMSAWRIAVRIDTARYAAGLILPFTLFASFFFYNAAKRRHIILRVIIIVFVIYTGYSLIRILYNAKTNNHFCYCLADSFDYLDQTSNNYEFRTYSTHFFRINRLTHLKNFHTPAINKDINLTIAHNRQVYPPIVSNIPSGDLNDDSSAYGGLKDIAYIIANKKGTKKQLIDLLSTESQCQPISQTMIPSYEPNLLENGDLEEIDSPEESYRKLTAHIGQYSLYYTFDPTIRTPQKAHFHNGAGATPFHPYYNCTNIDPISGQYSVNIRINYSVGYLLFYQQFKNGKYEFSFLVKGNQGTGICQVYDSYHNKSWHPTPLATMIIPDKRIYQIKTTFTVDYLNEGEYFLVGAWVQDGEAYLDNFTLKRLDD